MSKAFTRESDSEDFVVPARAPLPPGTRNYITKPGAERVQAELTRLLEQKGKLADTPSGQESEQLALEARIQYLQSLIASFVVVEPAGSDTVRFGTEVTLRRGKTEETYSIVGVDEIDLDRDHISWLSPLAKAITGKRAGDRVTFRSPAGSEELEILSIQAIND